MSEKQQRSYKPSKKALEVMSQEEYIKHNTNKYLDEDYPRLPLAVTRLFENKSSDTGLAKACLAGFYKRVDNYNNSKNKQLLGADLVEEEID